jgi:broad specificity phosphatase PhoE
MDKAQVLLMRHAEKPTDPLDPDLSPAGRQRAEKLVDYIPKTFGKPAFLFASAASKHSRRPIETITPLAQNCGLKIDESFADQDYEALAHELLTNDQYESKLILLCWHHGNIPPLAHALNAPHGDYPNPWDPTVFNLILNFKFRSGKPEVQEMTEPF